MSLILLATPGGLWLHELLATKALKPLGATPPLVCRVRITMLMLAAPVFLMSLIHNVPNSYCNTRRIVTAKTLSNFVQPLIEIFREGRSWRHKQKLLATLCNPWLKSFGKVDHDGTNVCIRHINTRHKRLYWHGTNVCIWHINSRHRCLYINVCTDSKTMRCNPWLKSFGKVDQDGTNVWIRHLNKITRHKRCTQRIINL